MNLKGNNAEKIATTLIIFFVMFVAYLLVCLIFNYLTGFNLENSVKDAMSFAATCITPIVAILLFNDWREEHQIKSLFSTLDLINSKAIEIEEIIIQYAHAVIDEDDIDRKEINIVDHLIRFSLLFRGIRNERHIDEYLKKVSSFYVEVRYLCKLSIVMRDDWIIVKKFEEFNKTKDVDEQVYPIPCKDNYYLNREKFIANVSVVEGLINNMIDETTDIKKQM
ncbi:hypothetical protein [Acinetobacter sp.]|uniref:hypothetical protein n=1 Tax=Acinetobacter sp. TaxID=472 RepID=UPI00289A827A|nr:hypothetical protein [Acinetobacter sp.]